MNRTQLYTLGGALLASTALGLSAQAGLTAREEKRRDKLTGRPSNRQHERIAAQKGGKVKEHWR